jgi:P-type Cu+ transporter
MSCGCSGASCDTQAPLPWLRIGLATMLAGQGMVVSLAINTSTMPAAQRLLVQLILAASAAITAGLLGAPLLTAARAQLARRALGFDWLFVSAILGATLASLLSMWRGQGAVYFELISLLLLIYTLGQQSSARAQRRVLDIASRVERSAQAYQARTCCGTTRQATLDQLKPDWSVLIPPGRPIPIDGVVKDGHALLNERAISGEPLPRAVAPGSAVLTGAIPIDASIWVTVSAAAGQRKLDDLSSRIDRLLLAPTSWQRQADRLAGWFLPVVVSIALLTGIAWTLLDGWVTGLMHATAVLFVACPCAMGFGVPLIARTSIARLAHLGVLLHRAEALERLAEIDRVVFDKTGTLTTPELELGQLELASGVDAPALLSALAQIAEQSDHPLSRMLRLPLHSGRGCDVERVEVLPGKGLRATCGAHQITLGVVDLLPDEHPLRQLPAAQRPRIVILRDGELAAWARVTERAVAGAHPALRDLEADGLKVAIVTGDAGWRAAGFGVEVHAGASPEDKLALIQGWQEAGSRVLYVGDGINDAGALAAAHASLSVRSGAALAGELAMGEWSGVEPQAIVEALRVARHARVLLRQTLGWAALYNTLGVSAAALGLIHPAAAAVLMTSSSLFVTLRAAWALELREPDAPATHQRTAIRSPHAALNMIHAASRDVTRDVATLQAAADADPDAAPSLATLVGAVLGRDLCDGRPWHH